MENLLFNKKRLDIIRHDINSLVGMTYSSQFLVQSTSAKKSSTDKISGTASTNNAVTNNNNTTSIALNALESKNETYTRQNTTQAINPTLHLIAHTDYVIKIKNPTDAKHELIIGSNGTELAKSNGIIREKIKISSSMPIQRESSIAIVVSS